MLIVRRPAHAVGIRRAQIGRSNLSDRQVGMRASSPLRAPARSPATSSVCMPQGFAEPSLSLLHVCLIRAGGVLAGAAILAANGCGGAASDSFPQRVLDCMRANGWVSAPDSLNNVVILDANDGHAAVRLVLWRSEAAARHAVPALAPLDVGWMDRFSWRASVGFTLADEEVLDRCLTVLQRPTA
jgi:hypothetical protein